jgi:hypothetical protein
MSKNFAPHDTFKQCNRKNIDSIDIFEPPGEPQLNTYIGFDSCQDCHYRKTYIQSIKDDVKNLRGGL